MLLEESILVKKKTNQQVPNVFFPPSGIQNKLIISELKS